MSMRIVAGCLRNDGTGWALYENATHFNNGIATVSNDDRWITVTCTGTINGVYSLHASGDETLARNGILVGGSGGGSLTKIGLSKNGVQLDPNDVSTQTYPLSNVWLLIAQEVAD